MGRSDGHPGAANLENTTNGEKRSRFLIFERAVCAGQRGRNSKATLAGTFADSKCF